MEQPNDPAHDILAAEQALPAEELGPDMEPAAGIELNPDLPRIGVEPRADQNDGAVAANRDEDLQDLEGMDATIDVQTEEEELERVQHYNSIAEEDERIVIISDEDSAPIINVEEFDEDDNRTNPPIVLGEHSGAGQLVTNDPETIDLTDSPLSPVDRRGSTGIMDSPLHGFLRTSRILRGSRTILDLLRSESRRNLDAAAGGQVSLPPVPDAPSASAAELEARVSQDPLPGPSSTATSATGSSTPPACPICLDSFEEIRNSGRNLLIV